jgi:hypothetical protein
VPIIIADLATAAEPVDLKPITDRLTKAEADIVAIEPYDDTALSAKITANETAIAAIKPYDDKPLTDRVKAAEGDITALNDSVDKRLVTVVRDHKPTDAEIDGSWGIWQSQIPDTPNVKINFFLWIEEGNYAQQLLAEDTVIPWEAIAKFDTTRQTYSVKIEGATLEYNKQPFAVLGNQTFDPPALVFNFKNADTVFNNVTYKAYNATDLEIGNGGQAIVAGENLTVVQSNPTLVGTGSATITKVIFELTRIAGTILIYPVNLV